MRLITINGRGVFACLLGAALSLPTSAADIAWVSFHAADNMPSAAAMTAGFTQAPDVGYTQALTAAGHNVTRILTHGQPFTPAETAALNAFDVVIVSRSAPSGNFQDPDETVFWNASVTAPVIHLGAYALRANRLGMYTGNTIPDTGPSSDATGGPGPVRLTVNNPSHPIFAGIALDGTNTTVNDFANVVMAPFAPNTVQRGISVVTDPIIAGGQVLATVGTPGDRALGGTIIAKFGPGLSTADATPDVLGGHRLILLTGTRENSGLTAEGAGIYDLTQDGQRMFLNAVNFMATIPEPSTMALLLVAIAGLGVTRKR